MDAVNVCSDFRAQEEEICHYFHLFPFYLPWSHGVAKNQTRLSDFTFTFHFHVLEKEMATHSSVLAWRIPGTAEPGGLLSMGSHRVGHDWSDLAAAAMGLDAMILFFFFFLIFSLKPAFLLSSFTLIKKFFSSSPLSAIRVVSSAYLKLLIFLPPILIRLVTDPARHFSWCAQHIC